MLRSKLYIKGKNLGLILILFYLSTNFIVSGCKKEDSSQTNVIETDSVVDIQGNVYKTVKIGDQWWMAENLKVEKYRDGSQILNVGKDDKTAWVTNNYGACHLFSENVKSRGLLYNYYAIQNPKGLAPVGWHIPTDDDWKKLEQTIGMSASESDKFGWRGSKGEGDKLKGLTTWKFYENVWGTNDYGFNALSGGCLLFNFQDASPGLESVAFWWTSSENSNNEVNYRYLDYKTNKIFRSHTLKNYGMSIRCVKD